MITSFLFTLLSTLFSIVTAFSNAGAAAEAPGTPVDMRAHLRGSSAYVTFDERLTQAFDAMEAETGFNISDVAASVPDLFRYQRWTTRLFPGLLYGLRDSWLTDGNPWLGVVIGMPEKMHLKTEPTEWAPDSEYYLVLEMTYADSSVRSFNTGNTYNAVTGILGYRTGLLGLGFNLNLKDMWAYTTDDPPQRALGYCKLYDDLLLQNKAVNAATVRLKFPYQGKDWMLQLWKGRYFTTTGGEIGIYNKPASRFIEFYDAATDEERIGMSFEIYITQTEQPLVVRPVQTHWWMTGFAINRYVYLPNQLTLKTEIVPTDEAMKQGLMAALDKEAASGVLSYTESDDGASLHIVW